VSKGHCHGNHVLAFYIGVHIGATEPCICGGDAALCQITLTTCLTFLPLAGELRKVLLLALSVTLFVYEISLEPLNGFAPNSQGRRVLSLARTSLKVRGQGHQGQKRHFSAILAACVRFVFGKTSLASS